MNKRINTDTHCFVSVVGPAGSGKTRLVARMLINQEKIFRPVFDKILYFYKHYQDSYAKLEAEALAKSLDLELIQGLQWKAVECSEALKKRTLVVIDGLYDAHSQII